VLTTLPPSMGRMSENVGASTSRNPKGLHGLYRENFTFTFTLLWHHISVSFISMLQVNISCTNQPLFYHDRMVYGFVVKSSVVEELYPWLFPRFVRCCCFVRFKNMCGCVSSVTRMTLSASGRCNCKGLGRKLVPRSETLLHHISSQSNARSYQQTLPSR
jgi:hypothetical protein